MQSAAVTRVVLRRPQAGLTPTRQFASLHRALYFIAVVWFAPSAGASPPIQGAEAQRTWTRFDALVAQAEKTMMADPGGALKAARAATLVAEHQKGSARYVEAAATGRWLEAEALTRLNRIQEARDALGRASTLAAAEGKLTKLDGDVELTRGRIADNSGDIALALRSFQRAHAIFSRLGKRRSQSIALQALGSIYLEAHDFNREVSYYREASKVYSGDPVLLLSASNNIGFALQQVGRYNEANANFRRALKIATSLKSPFLEQYILTNLAFVYAKQQKLAEAERAADRALKLLERSKDNGWAPFVWGVKGEIEFQRGAIQTAATQINRAFHGIDLTKTISPFRDIHEIAYRVYRAAGNYPLALAHLEAFKRLDDQGRSLAASANLALMGAQFDFANQQLEIEHLRSEQLRRDISLRESRAALQRILFLAGFGAALILIAWIGWRNVVVQRHRNAISEKNTELLKTLAERDGEIARRTEVETQLRLAIETAQQANRAKSHFLANMSHELRTPLNAIIGFSELMVSEGGKPGKAPEYAASIAEGGRHLLSIVNDILDMARIEAGKLTLAEAPVDLQELVQTTISVLGCEGHPDKSVSFEAAGTGPIVIGDEVRLRQVLINLISNALKFTGPDGDISVRLERAPDGVDIVVRDNGPGIPPDKLEVILEPFGQAENTYARAHGGAGLGLPIVKSLTELHGGKFRIQSQVGNGTEAHVHLPAERIIETIHKTKAAVLVS